MADRPRESLDALTGIRFLAALHVVLYHRMTMLVASAPLPVRNLVGTGDVAVSFFFLLSGFILAFVYLRAGAASRVDSRTFWIARLSRIYPVYVIGLLVAAPFFVYQARNGGVAGDPLGYIARVGALAATLLQAWVPSAACALNCPGWSLSAEAFFYFCFPLLAPLLARLGTRQLYALLLGLWALALVPGTTALALVGGELPRTVTAPLGHLPILRLAEFLMGVGGGLLFLRSRAAITSARWTPVAAPAALAVVLAVLSLRFGLPDVLIPLGLLAPVFLVLIIALASARGPLAAWFAAPAMVLLGEASYALYILHVPMGQWFDRIGRQVGIDAWRSPVWFAAYLALTIGVSIAAYRLVEVPARDALKALLSRQRRVAAPAPRVS